MKLLVYTYAVGIAAALDLDSWNAAGAGTGVELDSLTDGDLWNTGSVGPASLPPDVQVPDNAGNLGAEDVADGLSVYDLRNPLDLAKLEDEGLKLYVDR